jgi:hypothetical protein
MVELILIALYVFFCRLAIKELMRNDHTAALAWAWCSWLACLLVLVKSWCCSDFCRWFQAVKFFFFGFNRQMPLCFCKFECGTKVYSCQLRLELGTTYFDCSLWSIFAGSPSRINCITAPGIVGHWAARNGLGGYRCNSGCLTSESTFSCQSNGYIFCLYSSFWKFGYGNNC